MGEDRRTLEASALKRLRGALRAGQDASERASSAIALAGLAAEVGGQVTIDFEAAEELGHPVVVVRVPERPSPPACFEALSEREREVAALVARGLRNRQIARQLYISEATVKDHVHRILEKTGLPGRAAVAAAWR